MSDVGVVFDRLASVRVNHHLLLRHRGHLLHVRVDHHLLLLHVRIYHYWLLGHLLHGLGRLHHHGLLHHDDGLLHHNGLLDHHRLLLHHHLGLRLHHAHLVGGYHLNSTLLVVTAVGALLLASLEFELGSKSVGGSSLTHHFFMRFDSALPLTAVSHLCESDKSLVPVASTVLASRDVVLFFDHVSNLDEVSFLVFSLRVFFWRSLFISVLTAP